MMNDKVKELMKTEQGREQLSSVCDVFNRLHGENWSIERASQYGTFHIINAENSVVDDFNNILDRFLYGDRRNFLINPGHHKTLEEVKLEVEVCKDIATSFTNEIVAMTNASTEKFDYEKFSGVRDLSIKDLDAQRFNENFFLHFPKYIAHHADASLKDSVAFAEKLLSFDEKFSIRPLQYFSENVRQNVEVLHKAACLLIRQDPDNKNTYIEAKSGFLKCIMTDSMREELGQGNNAIDFVKNIYNKKMLVDKMTHDLNTNRLLKSMQEARLNKSSSVKTAERKLKI